MQFYYLVSSIWPCILLHKTFFLITLYRVEEPSCKFEGISRSNVRLHDTEHSPLHATYNKYCIAGYRQQGVIHSKFEKVDYMLISKTVQNNSTLAYSETAYEDLHTALPKMRVLLFFCFFF